MDNSPDKETVLVLGSGAREHAIVVSLLKSSKIGEIFVYPGNDGMLLESRVSSVILPKTYFGEDDNINVIKG